MNARQSRPSRTQQEILDFLEHPGNVLVCSPLGQMAWRGTESSDVRGSYVAPRTFAALRNRQWLRLVQRAPDHSVFAINDAGREALQRSRDQGVS